MRLKSANNTPGPDSMIPKDMAGTLLAVKTEFVRAAAAPAVKVDTAKLGDGGWFLGGCTHHSLVAEFEDYVAAIEAVEC